MNNSYKKGDTMRKLISAILVLIVLMTVIGCGEKVETQIQDNAETVEFPLRGDYLPFEVVMGNLRPVAKELAAQTPVEVYKVSENIYEQSFAIGVISADAVLAITSRDESKLKGYTEVLIEYSKNIQLKDEILKMADEIQVVLSNSDENKWEQLEKLIIDYQTEVQNALYDALMFDQFTLMQLGGWSEGLYRITTVYLKNWDEKDVKGAINQKGILNDVINNLTYIQSNKIKEAKYYGLATEGYAKIKDIIYSVNEDEFYTQKDVEHINKISAEIVNSIKR